MNYNEKRLRACVRPLTDNEMQAVEFISGPDNKIRIDDHVIDAVFRGGKILVNPRAVTI